ncbi:hypothetical protein E2C01_046078 [Portunus trituberculatus]|uniref:Uncharacterized protein n=1 Tax=Portunus trituberculatus TaxID=210409 RepID=A0A5B7G6M5_PORTR|nr:hypothetical protein [Portunus trituberculatus]
MVDQGNNKYMPRHDSVPLSLRTVYDPAAMMRMCQDLFLRGVILDLMQQTRLQEALHILSEVKVLKAFLGKRQSHGRPYKACQLGNSKFTEELVRCEESLESSD